MGNNNFKPECQLVGKNSNIFNLMGIASITLKENNFDEKAREMCSRVMESVSYYEALNILGEYVIIVGDELKMNDESLRMKLE